MRNSRSSGESPSKLWNGRRGIPAATGSGSDPSYTQTTFTKTDWSPRRGSLGHAGLAYEEGDVRRYEGAARNRGHLNETSELRQLVEAQGTQD